MKLVFVATTLFTKRISKLGLEADLRSLQDELLTDPERGDTDAGTGGLRKVRMGDEGRGQGKRGGARVHYLWLSRHSVVYLVFVYGKDESDALSSDQKAVLKEIVAKIKAEWDARSKSGR